MYVLYTQTPEFFGDLCDEIRLFYHVRKIHQIEEEEVTAGDCVFLHFFFAVGDTWNTSTELYKNGEMVYDNQETIYAPKVTSAMDEKRYKKRFVKQCMYEMLKLYTRKTMPWGSLTGIRPTKLARELSVGMDTARAKQLFCEQYDVTDHKADLAFEIVRNQKEYIHTLPRDIDIYIGIPFCVSRCKYCSFVSQDIHRSNALKDAYLDALARELGAFGDVLTNYSVRTIYIGGGTPTSLGETELDHLLQVVGDTFPIPLEYTVEAGRPDTVNKEKLQILQDHNVTRISINAQTTKQETLDLIGRAHSVQQFFDAFQLAREMGFGCINTDIILGLPQESMDDVKETLNQIAKLGPENITVHTLALKRSSEFVKEQKANFHDMQEMTQMVEYAHMFLDQVGYAPYYLYRQKYMSGNMENTGYAKPGYECIYNIDHMEETTNVLAFGAGAISKRVYGMGARIERAPNVKDVEHYIARTDEMIARKLALFGQ